MQTTGQTVLITGGTSGIGLALAKQFYSRQNRIIITGRDTAKISALRADHPDWIVEAADMTDPQSLDHLAVAHPETTILINNAGIQYNYDIADPAVAASLINEELQVNLLGPLYLTKLMLPTLTQKRSAAIINVTSSLGIVPKQSAAVYSASKAGLHMFTKALRWQLEATPVRVFEVIPPLVDTAMTAGRNVSKITAAALATEFMFAFAADRYEIQIGRAKQLLRLHRMLPGIVEQRMRLNP